jgi:uncharacterized protein involved in outer membrane biogenesis
MTMKCVLKIVAGLVVLLIIVAIAIPMFISADYLKSQLVTQVKAATGRTLEIKGKASLSIFPSIAVTVEDVTFGNPAGFASPYFAHIGSLQVGAALGPLLHKELLITGITLDSATLNLEQNAAGTTNWSFASPTAAKTPTPKTNTADATSSGTSLVINEAKIKDAAVNYHKFGASPMQFALSAVDATVAMNGANVDIDLGNASLYGGSIKGTAKHGGDDSVAVDMDLSGVQIEPLVTALTGGSQMKGTANVSVKVTGKGATQPAIMNSLDGSGDVKITDGAIKGINIANFLRNAKQAFVLGGDTNQSTDFSALTASYKITNGVLSNDDLSMLSPGLRLTGKGTLNLVQQTINYHAVPAIVGSLEGQGGQSDASGVGIPLNITGPWSAISVQPDLAGVVQGLVKSPAALKQNLQGLTGNIGLLFGKKPATGN